MNSSTDGNLTWMMYRTKGLDKAFFHNHKVDPTIGWQYFCNSSGYMRHFPAVNWNVHPVNTYDCRMRHWFTGAAVSPKDMIILIERSGSMTGVKLTIAQSVVRHILDTLTPNDFFNVIQFNDTIEYLDGCTEDKLLQATSFNVMHMKLALDNIKPRGQSDLAEALYETFDIFAKSKRNTANCNQAIVLITDGMEYNQTIQDIFKANIWDKGNKIRVFSFLVGEQIANYELRLMACENRGFYMKIDLKEHAQSSDTRQNAIEYIPVMARPLVLSTNVPNPVVWSSLYADLVDAQRTTNNDWNCKQNDMQRERVVGFLNNYDQFRCISETEPEEPNVEFRKYVFMTTVSMPAFDRGINEVREKVVVNEAQSYESINSSRHSWELQQSMCLYTNLKDCSRSIVSVPVDMCS
jgi:voltage-dependent calcium channel alpha-2/delta-3